ncbi:MAG: ABC transporter permease [Anaerolineales bacterium]|nr:ABC transporter permease [Anaerolineales bacterium]
MRNFWLLAKHEYRKMIGKRSFLLGTLGIPFLIIVVMGLLIFVITRGEDKRPIGYVDHAGILNETVRPPEGVNDDMVPMHAFSDETAAQSALEAGDIQAYYILAADYLQTRELERYYWQEDIEDAARVDFADFIRANLAAAHSDDLQTLLIDGPELTVRSLEGNREISSNNPFGFIIPFAAAFLFVFIVMGSAGYLLQVVTDEKENRTMEMMVTSVTPLQLIGGKALGLMAVSLTQLFIWLAVAVVAVLIGANYVPQLQDFTIPWTSLLIIALYFFPAYALIAGMMTAIGGAVTELQQGQQIAGILNMLFIFPFFFVALIIATPNSPILVALTLFPTTSFITVSMRWAINVIPTWQLVASWLILVATAVLSVYASAKIFRVGMLRYGQSLNLRGVWSAMRSR